MDIQIVDTQTVTEPITLAEAKAYLQIDADYASNDNDINTCLISARKRLEAYLNIGLVQRTVTVYWGGHELELPLSPTVSITNVKKGSDTLTTNDYSVLDLPAKRIMVNSASGLNGDWFYSINGSVEFTPTSQDNNTVYTCEYVTGYDTLPGDLKQAILAECSYLYKLRGEPVTDLISPNALMLASSYSRNLVL